MPVIWLVLVRSVAAGSMGAVACDCSDETAAALILFIRSRNESMREGDGRGSPADMPCSVAMVGPALPCRSEEFILLTVSRIS